MSTPSLSVGGTVRLSSQPPYLKTADPMPMLRPPDLVAVGEKGTILDRRAGGYWGVKFASGAFLLDSQYLEPIAADEAADTNATEQHHNIADA